LFVDSVGINACEVFELTKITVPANADPGMSAKIESG
jgi:hypothetical protein